MHIGKISESLLIFYYFFSTLNNACWVMYLSHDHLADEHHSNLLLLLLVGDPLS